MCAVHRLEDLVMSRQDYTSHLGEFSTFDIIIALPRYQNDVPSMLNIVRSINLYYVLDCLGFRGNTEKKVWEPLPYIIHYPR